MHLMAGPLAKGRCSLTCDVERLVKKVGCDWNWDSEWGGGDQIAERASDRKFGKMEGVRRGITGFLSTLTQSLCA
jgi:hypothetical protein